MNTPSNFRGASRARSCQSKQPFKNSGHARRAMKSLITAGKVIGETRVYKCKFCGLWHWGGTGGPTVRYAKVVRAIDAALAKDAKRIARQQDTGSTPA